MDITNQRKLAQSQILNLVFTPAFRKILDHYMDLKQQTIDDWNWDDEFHEYLRKNYPETQRKFGVVLCAFDHIDDGKVDNELQNYVEFVNYQLQRTEVNAVVA